MFRGWIYGMIYYNDMNELFKCEKLFVCPPKTNKFLEYYRYIFAGY